MFNKTFYNNGTYSDSDGYSGKWNINKIDELLISVKNNATGTYIETKSNITDINSFKFSYTVTGVNNVKYDYYFKISYE